MTPAALTFSAKSRRTPESPISYYMAHALDNPALISLAAGFVDAAALPITPIARAVEQLLADPRTARAALQYGTTQGHGPLREKVLRHVNELDGTRDGETAATPADVIITTGSQQLLCLLTEILLDEGDIVITEAPSYFVYHSVLASSGVRVLTVPMDDDGMRIDDLALLLRRLEQQGELHRVKLIYVVDYFQNPSGRTMTAPRRRELFGIVRRYGQKQRILILEDAAYRELRFEGDDLPSIRSLDAANRFVVYAGTFSKPCAPGLKTGYAIMPRELVEPLLRLKGNHDFGSNNLSQYVVDLLLANGDYQKHVEYLRGSYRRKRDAMMAALEEYFDDLPGAHWTTPAGGLFVWLTLAESILTGPSGSLMQSAIAEGVLYIPGEFGHVNEDGPRPTNEMRLSYGDASVEQIHEGIRRLRKAVDGVSAPRGRIESESLSFS